MGLVVPVNDMYYKGLIKVVRADKQCYPVDPVTLEAVKCSCYDPSPWSLTNPDNHEAVEVITQSEYISRWSEKFDKERKARIIAEFYGLN